MRVALWNFVGDTQSVLVIKIRRARSRARASARLFAWFGLIATMRRWPCISGFAAAGISRVAIIGRAVPQAAKYSSEIGPIVTAA